MLELLSFKVDSSNTLLLKDLVGKIWPHRADHIYSLYLREASDYNATDQYFFITLNKLPIGLTGFYKYNQNFVGLCWHGVCPDYRNKGFSVKAFEQVCAAAIMQYPTAKGIIELIPSDKDHQLAPYFKKLGFYATGEVATFEYLPKGPIWQVYQYNFNKTK